MVLPAFFTHGVSVDVFYVFYVLVLWGVDAIQGNGYRIQGQNYVAIFQRNEN